MASLKPHSLKPQAFVVLALVALFTATRADEPKKDDKTPRVLVVAPLGISPGVATKFIARGMQLDAASEVRATSGDKKLEVKLGAKQKVGVPQNQELKKHGDTQVEFELTVPDGPGEKLSLVVVTPQGEAKPYELPITAAANLIAEKEPNDGFDQAQAIELDKVIVGKIDGAQNVDVFSLQCQAGQKLVVEVAADTLGSPLDCQLVVYSSGAILASNDDQAGSADPLVKLVAPATGPIYFALSDANDQGGAMYGYRLTVKTWDGK